MLYPSGSDESASGRLRPKWNVSRKIWLQSWKSLRPPLEDLPWEDGGARLVGPRAMDRCRYASVSSLPPRGLF